MVICICNNLNEDKVKEAIKSGSKTADEVYRYHKCCKQCGQCEKYIQKIIDMPS